MKKLAFILFAGFSMTMSAASIKGKFCGAWQDNTGRFFICCGGGEGVCASVVNTAIEAPDSHSTLTTYKDGNPDAINNVYHVKNVQINEDEGGATLSADLLD